MHVVLHLDANDGPGTQAWNDLSRAIEHVDRTVWREARSSPGLSALTAKWAQSCE